MNIDLLKAELERDEDVRLEPYDDATGKELRPGDKLIGNLTIGTGRNLTGVGISKEENDIFLANDINERVLPALNKFLPWWVKLNDIQQRVLSNMIFNMGIKRVLDFQIMLGRLQANDLNGAAEAMLDSLWAKQVGDRAKRMAEMMKSGA